MPSALRDWRAWLFYSTSVASGGRAVLEALRQSQNLIKVTRIPSPLRGPQADPRQQQQPRVRRTCRGAGRKSADEEPGDWSGDPAAAQGAPGAHAGRRRPAWPDAVGAAGGGTAGHPADRGRTDLVILSVEQGAIFAGRRRRSRCSASWRSARSVAPSPLRRGEFPGRSRWRSAGRQCAPWTWRRSAYAAAAVGLLLAVAAVQGAAAALLRRRIPPSGPAVEHWPWWDLPARAVATACAGPGRDRRRGGARARRRRHPDLFPVAVSVVCAFVLAEEGRSRRSILLEGILRGLTGFAVFCFGVAVLLPGLAPVTAFVSADGGGRCRPAAGGALSGRRGPGRAGPPAPR